ncbi:unnamed protein product [Spirodela intermedia]|uniref:Uncharacterized protein n=1 Tax=Spirodela intermedia TaxID=51605 RepID=A0A7I8I961_SPIIN|nr:unnamed protein product [Spirodela intermedia]CAA6653602.1 unnamed protein product [Spirodela intermedia]
MSHENFSVILTVDLACTHCHEKIKKVLTKKYEVKWKIQSIVWDEKNNKVTLTGPFCPPRLAKKLRRKARKIIKEIDIPVLCSCDCDKPPDLEPPRTHLLAPQHLQKNRRRHLLAPQHLQKNRRRHLLAPQYLQKNRRRHLLAPSTSRKTAAATYLPPSTSRKTAAATYLPPPVPEEPPPPPPPPEAPFFCIPVAYPPVWPVCCCCPYYTGQDKSGCGCHRDGGHRPCFCGCGRGCGSSAADYGRPCNSGCKIEFICDEEPSGCLTM